MKIANYFVIFVFGMISSAVFAGNCISRVTDNQRKQLQKQCWDDVKAAKQTGGPVAGTNAENTSKACRAFSAVRLEERDGLLLQINKQRPKCYD